MSYYNLENQKDLAVGDLPFSRGENLKWANLLSETIAGFNKRLLDLEKFCVGQQFNEDLYHNISETINRILPFFKAFEDGVGDRKLIKCAQIIFRDKTNPIFLKSYYFNRARTWPEGYQGDYITLENIYRNMPLSIGIGYYLDLYCLNSPLAIAVKNRIKLLEELVRQELGKRKNPSLLNIACGSCRELMNLAVEIMDSGASVTCIDNDENALRFSMKRLSTLRLDDYVKFYKYNAIRMFDIDSNLTEFGRQDVVYSVGFFDYLPSDLLVRMFRAIYELLNPGGTFIAAFKDAQKYDHRPYHWLADWDGFLQRTPEDFMKIFALAEIPRTAISETREATETIVFYIIRK